MEHLKLIFLIDKPFTNGVRKEHWNRKTVHMHMCVCVNDMYLSVIVIFLEIFIYNCLGSNNFWKVKQGALKRLLPLENSLDFYNRKI